MLLLFAFDIFGIATALAQIPAFPEAQGFGALQTSGGRGGQVIYVTNLNCTGAGSLNAALATPGSKYILFKVSGIIDCAAEILMAIVILQGNPAWRHYRSGHCGRRLVRTRRKCPKHHYPSPVFAPQYCGRKTGNGMDFGRCLAVGCGPSGGD